MTAKGFTGLAAGGFQAFIGAKLAAGGFQYFIGAKRAARNPGAWEPAALKARHIVKFRPAKAMKD